MSVWSKTNTTGSLILIIAVLISNALYLLLNLFLIRTISLEDFATFTVINSISLFFIIISHAIGTTVQHKISNLIGKGKKFVLPTNKFFLTITFISLFFGIVWFLLNGIISTLFQVQDHLALMFMIPILLTAILYTIIDSIFRGNFLFLYVSMFLIAESITKFIVGTYGATVNNKYLVFAALPISLTLGLALSIVFLINHANKRQKTTIKFSNKFFISALMLDLAYASFLVIDILLVKIFFDPEIAGLYAILSIIGKVLILLGHLPLQFILSFVSYEGNRINSTTTYNILSGLVLFILLLAYIPILIFGNLIFPLIFGEKILQALQLIPLYSVAIILYINTNTVIIYHLAKKHYKIAAVPLSTIIFTALGITLFHQNLKDVVWVILTTNLIGLLVALAYHNRYMIRNGRRNTTLFLHEIIDLFKRIPLQKGQKNILFLNWRDTKHTSAGGAEKYIKEIGTRLAQKGYAIVWFTSNDGNNKPIETANGVTMIRKGGFVSVYIFAFLYYIFHLRKWTDVIIDSQNGVPFFSPLYSKKLVILLMHHVHQKIFKDNLPFGLAQFAMWIEKYVMHFFYKKKKIVTVSSSTKKGLIDLGYKSDQIEIIHNGVDQPKRLKQNKKSETPVILYLGRLKKYKRVDLLIEAVRQIKDVELIIAGDGSEKRNLQKIVRRLGLKNKITFKGFVNEHKKSELLSSAWMVVQPSQCEGWSITNLEANAHGTPVVGFDVPGTRDSVIDNQTGLLCKEETANCLAKKVKQLITEAAVRKKLSIGALEHSQKFSWDESAKKFESIIYKQ